MDRHSSNLSKTYRIWHLKCFRDFLDNESKLHLVIPLASERKMDLEETCYRISANMARLAIWARYCSCLDCLTLCCINRTCRTHRKMTADTRWTVLQGSCFIEVSVRQSAGHREK